SSPKLDRKAEPTFTLSIPSGPQKRAWAKGRSLETLTTVVFSRSAVRELNSRTLLAQIPVSTLGKMSSTTRVPSESAWVSAERPSPTRSQPRACEPTVGSSPTVWTGLPLSAVVARCPFLHRPAQPGPIASQRRPPGSTPEEVQVLGQLGEHRLV